MGRVVLDGPRLMYRQLAAVRPHDGDERLLRMLDACADRDDLGSDAWHTDLVRSFGRELLSLRGARPVPLDASLAHRESGLLSHLAAHHMLWAAGSENWGECVYQASMATMHACHEQSCSRPWERAIELTTRITLRTPKPDWLKRYFV